VKLEYNLWQMYSFVSDSLDNLAAYLAVGVLWLGLAAVWPARHGAGNDTAATVAGGTDSAAPQTAGALLAVLWIAACSFLLFYPRMDYAHLYGATPLLSIVGVALLGQATEGVRQTRGRLAVCAAAVLLGVVGLKSAPRVYSRVMVQRSAAGVQLVATPVEWLEFARARLYFPIYLERQRAHLAAFRELVHYVQDTTPRGAPVFAFPALPMLYFLSEHDNPTRHDYFLGDNVSDAEQLEVIRTLERRAVPVVVMMNDPSNYFVEQSAATTQVLRDYLTTRYYRERRIGPYDVLRRYGSPAGGGGPA
jgi:predicted secreted protein